MTVVRSYDPGLQPERTSLAWTRTAVALLANVLVMLRIAWLDQSVPFLITSSFLLMASIILMGYGIRRGKSLLSSTKKLPNAQALPFLAACVLLACGSGAAAVFLHASRN